MSLAGVSTRFFAGLGTQFLPFADAASAELPMGRLLRLSLFQVTVGVATVLLNGTLNRVMIVELGTPAWLVALMIAIPLLVAPFRALIGHKSDYHKSMLGWRRVPYIWFGSLLQFGGLAIMPFALLLLSRGDTFTIGMIAGALAFLFTGLGLLQFFGISLAAFRIAGGILLLFLGLDMARGDFLAMFADKDALSDSKDVRGYARRRFQRLVVPFAIPLMIGPGAISAVIINAGEAAQLGYAGMAGSVVAIAAACVVSCICFALTGYLSRVLGEVGMAIIVKVLGLILCALAIQFILLGLGEAIPGMISGAVTTPYPAAS